MSKLVDKERLAKLAAALDARAKAAVKAEEERALAAEQAIDAKADANAAAIAAINNEETGLLKQAKDHAQGLVDGEKERAEEQEGLLADRIANLEGIVGSEAEGAFGEVKEAVAENAAAIAKLNGGADEEGSVAKAVADAVKVEEDRAREVEEDHEGRIAANEAFVAAQPAVDKAQDDRLSLLEEMMGLGGAEGDKTAIEELQESIEAAQDAADAAQADVDAVEQRLDAEGGLVDRIEANEANIARLDGAVDVEGSVKKQIADAIAGVKSEVTDGLADRVEVLEGEMDSAEGRLDVVEGKLVGLEEVEGKDVTVQNAIDKAQADAEAKAAELDAALKQELQDEIDRDVQVVADELAKQKDAAQEGTLAHQIKVEKERMDAFMADADVQQGAVDTLKELQAYIDTHGEAAQKMVDDIAANKTAIETEAARAAKKEEDIEKALADAIAKEVEDRDAAIKVVTDAQAEINEDVEARVAANEAFVAAQPAVDAEQDRRLKALEDANAEGGAMAEAVQAAQDAADAAQEAAEAAQGAADAAQADVDAIEKRLDDEGGLVDRIEAAEAFVAAQPGVDEAQQEAIDDLVGRMEAMEAFEEAHDHSVMEKGIADNKAAIEKEVEDRNAAIEEALKAFSTTEEMKAVIGNVVNSLSLTIENDQVVLKLGGEDGVALTSVSLDMATDADIDAIIAGLDTPAGE